MQSVECRVQNEGVRSRMQSASSFAETLREDRECRVQNDETLTPALYRRERENRSQFHRKSGAFTLIEIMISIAILGAIMAAIYSSWYSIMKGTKIGLASAAEVQRARIAMKTVEDALVGVQLFIQNIDHYAFIADTSDKFAYLSLVANLPQTFPRSGKFGDMTVRRITFSVEPGPDRDNQLVMRQQPYLMDTNIDEEMFPLVLAKNIEEFTLEFWDINRGEWMSGMIYTNQLPPMVRITMAFGSATTRKLKPEDYVTRVVNIPATAVPREWQIPTVPLGQPGLPGGPRPPGTPGAPGTPGNRTTSNLPPGSAPQGNYGAATALPGAGLAPPPLRNRGAPGQLAPIRPGR